MNTYFFTRINFASAFFIYSCCLLIFLNSCTESNSVDNSNKKIKDEVVVAPSALPGFDKFFKGSIGGALVSLNLRRYSMEISGEFWYENRGLEIHKLKGKIEADNRFNLAVLDNNEKQVGNLTGTLKDDEKLSGLYADLITGGRANFDFSVAEDLAVSNLRLEDLEVNRNSAVLNQHVKIVYPHLTGIEDKLISERVNSAIEYFFESNTLKDSIEVAKFDFKEDVKYDVSYFKGNLISINKHHILSRNKDTQIFDDSHGILINFKRGKVFELRDLFKPNAIEQLNKIILERINKSCNNTLDEQTLAKCILSPQEKTSFSLTNNKKITFHLTERLPYKNRGCGYVRIELKDLQPLFNPSGPLNSLIEQPKSK